MKKNILNVVVSSPGNSGGGAIHDYLLSREDFLSPFYGEEFRLINDPYGIDNLYKNFYKNFSLNSSSEAFFQFKEYCLNLEKLISKKNNKVIYGKNFYKLSIDYLNKIEQISYRALPQYKRISLNFKNKNLYKIKKKLFKLKNHEHEIFKVKIPKNEKIFLSETKKYLKKIFRANIKNINNKNIVLDQSTNFWEPEIINKYIDNCKIILVTRDPRSIYYSMKSRESFAYPGYDLKIFVEWYKYIMTKKKKISKKFNNKIIELKFENFIVNFNKEKKKLNDFLEIKQDVKDKFDHEFSKKNLYKAKYKLNKYELSFIKRKLKDYLQW